MLSLLFKIRNILKRYIMKSFKLLIQALRPDHVSVHSIIPVILMVLTFVVTSCNTTKNSPTQKQGVEMISDNDSTEYSLIVLDPGYDFFLASQPSANFYSQQYYENWNKQYVMEWNARHRNPLQYGSFYETEIDYNAREDYGLDLNYRLYQYFQFIKNKYGITLIERGR